MPYSIFIDNEGNQRIVTDGVIEPKPGMGIPDSEKGGSRPRMPTDEEKRRSLGIAVREARKRESFVPMTEAQDERIIELLERLVDGRKSPAD